MADTNIAEMDCRKSVVRIEMRKGETKNGHRFIYFSLTHDGACYCSIADGMDVRSGEEVGADEEESNHELDDAASASLQHEQAEQMTSTKSMSSSTRRNKRKNFQPRNIRPGGYPGDDEEGDDEEDYDEADDGGRTEELSAAAQEEGSFRLGRRQGRKRRQSPSSSNSSLSSSPSAVSHPLDLSEEAQRQQHRTRHRAFVEGAESADHHRSRPKSEDGILEAAGGAVDLSLMRRTATRRSSSEGDENDGAVSSSEEHEDEERGSSSAVEVNTAAIASASNLQMKTWMLLWQQQQEQQPSRPQPPSESSSGDVPSQLLPTGRMTDASAMKDYVETTMRQLLGLYGLPEDVATQFIAQHLPLGQSPFIYI